MNTKILLVAFLTIGLVACKNNSKQNQVDQEKIYERLFEAIDNGDVKTFDLLVEHLPNIDSLIVLDSIAEVSYTPLGYACYNKRCDFAEKLIKQNADINRGREDQIFAYDALYLGIESGSECIVKLLLNKSADPNVIYNEYGETPLSLSIRTGKSNQIAKMLIEKGANINGAGDLGFEVEDKIYPLFTAIENDNAEMAYYLIEKACQLDIYHSEGTPLSIIQEKGDKELEALILKQLKKNYKYHIDESWYGDYGYETPAVSNNDGMTSMQQAYTLEIMPDSCVFSGIGFQLYFIEKCTVEETTPNELTVRFYNLTEGESVHYKEPYVVKLIRKDNKYYFNSPVIFGDKSNNVDLEASKK